MATDHTRKLVLAGCRMLLRSIARVLLKSGITWKEFADVSRSSFVEVASAEFGLRGMHRAACRITEIGERTVGKRRLVTLTPARTRARVK